MINPYNGVLLNGRFYDYQEGDISRSITLKNSTNNTQNSRTSSVLGGTHFDMSLTLALDNTYEVKAGSSNVGETTWLGVSRLDDFDNYISAQGVSMPLVFVNPWGAIFNVIPIGSYDLSIHNPARPNPIGTEFRVSLTLSSTD